MDHHPIVMLVDADDMIRRCDLPNLYRNLKQQHTHIVKKKSQSHYDEDGDDDDHDMPNLLIRKIRHSLAHLLSF